MSLTRDQACNVVALPLFMIIPAANHARIVWVATPLSESARRGKPSTGLVLTALNAPPTAPAESRLTPIHDDKRKGKFDKAIG